MSLGDHVIVVTKRYGVMGKGRLWCLSGADGMCIVRFEDGTITGWVDLGSVEAAKD